MNPQLAAIVARAKEIETSGGATGTQAAREHYQKSGQHLGKFKSIKEADAYAESLHQKQAEWYK